MASSRLGRLVLALATVAAIGQEFATLAAAADASRPTYRTIAPMDARRKHGETRYRAEVQPLPAEPYAWGWFGARPRPQAAWQRGYYGDLRFWSRGGW